MFIFFSFGFFFCTFPFLQFPPKSICIFVNSVCTLKGTGAINPTGLISADGGTIRGGLDTPQSATADKCSLPHLSPRRCRVMTPAPPRPKVKWPSRSRLNLKVFVFQNFVRGSSLSVFFWIQQVSGNVIVGLQYGNQQWRLNLKDCTYPDQPRSRLPFSECLHFQYETFFCLVVVS